MGEAPDTKALQKASAVDRSFSACLVYSAPSAIASIAYSLLRTYSILKYRLSPRFYRSETGCGSQTLRIDMPNERDWLVTRGGSVSKSILSRARIDF